MAQDEPRFHVPAPHVRPGDTPDFSHLDLQHAGEFLRGAAQIAVFQGFQATLDHGFEHQGERVICAVTKPANTRSLKVMNRLGMIHRGMTRAYYGLDCVLYEMTHQRWTELKRSR